jgi:hypothetical protein
LLKIAWEGCLYRWAEEMPYMKASIVGLKGKKMTSKDI